MTEWKAEMRPEWQDCPSCNGCNNYEVEALVTRANEELTKVRAERDAALARVRELTEWRPMETAPKGHSGTDDVEEFDTRVGPNIIIHEGGDGVSVAHWTAGMWSTGDGWQCYPVAWLPLPEPPKEGA